MSRAVQARPIQALQFCRSPPSWSCTNQQEAGLAQGIGRIWPISLQMLDAAQYHWLAAGSQGWETVKRSGFGREMLGMNHSSHAGLHSCFSLAIFFQPTTLLDTYKSLGAHLCTIITVPSPPTQFTGHASQTQQIIFSFFSLLINEEILAPS